MRVAVTGATGGLGRNLVAKLLSEGHAVTALGRNKQVGAELTKLGARFAAGDLREEGYLLAAFQHQDAIVHSAALASPWGKWSDFEKANVEGTAMVVNAAVSAGVRRLVHISTPSIYYTGRPLEMIKEDSVIPPPLTHYAGSKILAEEIVQKAQRAGQLDTILLRPRALFGPYDQQIVPRIHRMMKKGFFLLPDRGNALVDVTCIANVVHAIELALQAPASLGGHVYNITNNEPLSVAELTREVAQAFDLKVRFITVPSAPLRFLGGGFEFVATHLTHREPPLTRYSIGLLSVSQTLSTEKAQRELGYHPVLSTREGLRQFAQWLKGPHAS